MSWQIQAGLEVDEYTEITYTDPIPVGTGYVDYTIPAVDFSRTFAQAGLCGNGGAYTAGWLWPYLTSSTNLRIYYQVLVANFTNQDFEIILMKLRKRPKAILNVASPDFDTEDTTKYTTLADPVTFQPHKKAFCLKNQAQFGNFPFHWSCRLHSANQVAFKGDANQNDCVAHAVVIDY